MTEETLHEEQPLFGTENKIFQDLRYYKLLDLISNKDIDSIFEP